MLDKKDDGARCPRCSGRWGKYACTACHLVKQEYADVEVTPVYANHIQEDYDLIRRGVKKASEVFMGHSAIKN